ncbi:MAG: hypothetical protein KGY41_11230 [Desulfovermiculus sp.]|nr:hypothetical protein [Desulfovermiculus sp.]
MAQRAWISSLSPNKEAAASLIQTLASYGINATGHIWDDDLDQLGWMGPRDEIVHPDTGMWIILDHEAMLERKSVRYGLSLLILTVMANRGSSFPLILINANGTPVDQETLPTMMKGLDSLCTTDASLGAKLVAFMHTKHKATPPEYYADVYGNPHIGQWFEIGPMDGIWNGAMFAVDSGEIAFHAAGPRGVLPEKATMEYPVKEAKIQFGQREYTAWACQNNLTRDESYFVQAKGHPDSILFGPFSQSDEAEVFILDLV